MSAAKTATIDSARRLARQLDNGVLSTHSVSNEGFPFGSVSTHICTQQGDIVFYISDLAQHTKNLQLNPKMSFTLYHASDKSARDQTDDPNAKARLTLLGQAFELSRDDAQYAAISQRYFAIHPNSLEYAKAHDFRFYKMLVCRARFIGGFGDIHWLSGDDWHLPDPQWLANEQAMIDHMNQDHVDAMQFICARFAGLEAEQIKMLSLDPDGAYYAIDGSRTVFIPFGQQCYTSKEVRKALVEQTRLARAALNESQAALEVVTPSA